MNIIREFFKTRVMAPADTKAELPTRTRTTHDFRSQSWGHAFHCRATEPDEMKGSVHVADRVRVGDEMIWATGYGEAVGRVIEALAYADPDDMWRVRLAVTERRADLARMARNIADGTPGDEHYAEAKLQAEARGFIIKNED